MNFRALIVDDEAVARRHLAGLLRREPDVVIVGEARNGVEALRMLNEMPVDLLLLDVQMPGVDGFAVLRQMSVRPFVVFTTAHDEYALAAFRANAVEYLLKPIAAEDVSQAMRKVRERARTRQGSDGLGAELLGQVETPRAIPRQILVSVRDSLRPLHLDQIVCLEARDKSTIIYTPDARHEVDKGLHELEARLSEGDFVRIHRRHIVNIRYIKELKKWGNRQYKVELIAAVPTELYVSRRCVDDVLRRLGGTA